MTKNDSIENKMWMNVFKLYTYAQSYPHYQDYFEKSGNREILKKMPILLDFEAFFDIMIPMFFHKGRWIL